MARKQVDRLLSELTALADRLSELDDARSAAELDEMLKVAGSDPVALRKRLHEGIQAIAARLRAAGKMPPQYLREVSQATAPISTVTALSPDVALEKLRTWLRELGTAAGMLSAAESIRVLRAYRRTKDLSTEDARILDELEAQLRSRAMEGRNGGDSEE